MKKYNFIILFEQSTQPLFALNIHPIILQLSINFYLL